MKVKVSGVWKDSSAKYTKVSGTWRTVDNSYVRVSGTWRRFYSKFPIINTNVSIGYLNFFGEYYGFNKSDTNPQVNAGSIDNMYSTRGRIYQILVRAADRYTMDWIIAGNWSGMVGKTMSYAGVNGTVSTATYEVGNPGDFIQENFTRFVVAYPIQMPGTGTVAVVV